MLAAALAVTAFAAGSVTFTMSASEEMLSAGEEVTLTVSCTANSGATSYGLLLKFDENIFEVVSGNVTVEDTLVNSNGVGTSYGFVFMFEEAVAYSGQVGTAVLKVKDSAPAGSYTVTGNASAKNGSETVESTGCSVTVTVSPKTVIQESTASSEPVDIGQNIESITLPENSRPVAGNIPEVTVPVIGAPVESAPTTGAESTLTIGAENVPQEEDEGFPSWIFLAAAGVIAVVGVTAFVVVKKKK